jgi:hypothetical protein
VKFYILIVSLTAGLLLESCGGRPRQDQSAVEKGVMDYLENKAGLDIKGMDVAISSVAFREGEADATVTFKAKGSTGASNMMTMKYVLEHKDGKWVVKGRSGGSGGHGSEGMGGGAMPPGHPPAGGADSGMKK